MGVHFQTELWKTHCRIIKLERLVKRKRSMSKKFKVGDRVVGVGVVAGKNIEGLIGTVVKTQSDGYGIDFDLNIGGHSCSGNARPQHGWFVCESHLKSLKDEIIVIHRKDNEVIAHNKITGKTALAKCSPEDKFDFGFGAKLALERLFAKETKIVKQKSYKVGDKVKIRAWDDMEKEFGLRENGSIDCMFSFTKAMKQYCGKIMTIDGTHLGGYTTTDTFLTLFSTDMIEGKVVESGESAKPTEKPKVEEPARKFKVGDKVKTTINYCDLPKGVIGTVVKVNSSNYTVDFGFKYPNSTHDCGILPNSTGLWLRDSSLEKVD